MRRVEELLMSPKSGCTVHWLTFIYPHPIVSCKILRLCASVFARHFAQDDRMNGVAGCPRCHVPQERWPLCRVPRKCVIALHNLIPRTATCRRCRIPRKCVIALHNLIPRTATCRRSHIREQTLLHYTTLFRGQRRVAVAVFRENALLHYTALFRGQRQHICFCGTHKTILSLAQKMPRRQQSARRKVRQYALSIRFLRPCSYFAQLSLSVCRQS